MGALGRLIGGAFFALCLCIAAADAAAACLTAPAPPPGAVRPADAPQPPPSMRGNSRYDAIGRVVAPVSINGQGPFRFIVDTGANRTVLSAELAQRLNLTNVGEGDVHSIDGVLAAPLAQVDTVTYGDLALSGGRLPVLQSERVLAGEAGILGVDGMEGRRLRLDFDRQCIEIVSARHAQRLSAGWITVRGELRFGRLVMLHGRVRDVAINVLVDTGSNGTLGNFALRDALQRVALSREDFDRWRVNTAGRPIVLNQAVIIPHITLGGLVVNNITAYVGDYHVFALWGLQDQPTLLIGMDVLSQTKAIAIDYERATVHFRVARETYYY